MLTMRVTYRICTSTGNKCSRLGSGQGVFCQNVMQVLQSPYMTESVLCEQKIFDPRETL